MSCTWIVAALVAVYWLLPAAWAQDSGEDVQITPRVEQTQTKNGEPIDDPTLKTHTKPIKVDVNLALVPVSIVDPENRQVTGMDKENFEVFEGKDRQQIQHFSSEDAPVSLGAIFDVSGRVQPKRPIRTADTVLRGAETNCYAPASSPHDSKGKPMLAVRLLVVDDHAIVRRSVCALISHDPTLNVICETASGEDAIKKAYELQPDLVLLDIGLPGISGIETARQIRSVSPKSKIIFLSQHDSLHMANEALRAGGHGYVTKADAGSELLKAIRTVREGTCFVSKRIVDQGWTAAA